MFASKPAYFFLFMILAASTASGAPQAWVATWAASPAATDPDPGDPLLSINGQTVRQRLRVSVGGERVRVRLSNEYGAAPLRIGSASIALAIDAVSVKKDSLHALTFGGHASVTIPAGAPMLSDALDLRVPANAQLAVSLYFPERVSTPTVHGLALKRAIVTARGDFTRAEKVEPNAQSESWLLLSAVLVPAQPNQQLIVAFGDSIVDGDGSTVDADRNWPSDLARRLNQRTGANPVAVVNAGIAGNRLLADDPGIKSLGVSALARFDRDVLSVPGVTHVVLLEGLNDLGFPGAVLRGRTLAPLTEIPTADDLIGGYRQLIDRAHTRGVKVIGATLNPFEGVDLPGYYSATKETTRQAVNSWIRTSGEFDGVIDFDAVLRDNSHSSRLQARFASADHLHPNDAGYQAMADAIDLSLFEPSAAKVSNAHVFELNIYHARHGRVPALAARFRDASGLQTKHGLNVLGYWVPYGDDPEWNDTFIYMLAHTSRAEADRNWASFHADPQFQKYVIAEDAEHLIDRVETVYLRATDYSKMQ
jgi:lysophospholipase L1-like esterase